MHKMFLPRVVLFRVVIIMLLLKQKLFLGISSVARMTARRGNDKFRWFDE